MLTPGLITAAARFADALDAVAPTLSIQGMRVLLAVHADPGRSPTDYAARLGLPFATTSRLLLDLSEGTRGGRALGLLDRTQDRRNSAYHPSQRLLDMLDAADAG